MLERAYLILDTLLLLTVVLAVILRLIYCFLTTQVFHRLGQNFKKCSSAVSWLSYEGVSVGASVSLNT